jgi:serine/threonine-protein kinase HipA
MSSISAIFHLFDGLSRLAPGSDASTRRALSLIPCLPENPLVLDLGCGTGRQSLLLARELDSRVTAVDTHQPCLDALCDSAAKAGLAERIETRCISMDDVAQMPGPADLIWSEGAIYNIGVENSAALVASAVAARRHDSIHRMQSADGRPAA